MNDDKEKKEQAITQAQEDSGFGSWLEDLEEKEQPKACSIENPDCQSCGS